MARWTARYAERPDATALVSFAPRDTGWSSASWRDSGVGYAGGRFAMDVNAIWAPRALEATAQILDGLRGLGISLDSIGRAHPDLAGDSPLPLYAHDPSSLRRATDTWWGAWRHFEVAVPPAAIRSSVAARLAEMPPVERRYWAAKARSAGAAPRDTLRFLALSLDANGRPIPVANTDPATRLFLGEDAPAAFRPGETARARTLRDVRLFVRDYPVGLFIDRVGPVVANDAYAAPPVWHGFERDPYHGPRVVWGREVNLFLLGVSDRITRATAGGARQDAGSTAYLRELRDALRTVRGAAQASGFHSELWSYDFVHGRPAPVRYGTSSDVQLWSTTELAVEFALSRIPR